MEQLRLRATLDALKEIAGYVKAAAESAGLESRKAYRLRLAVDEVAANIVIHGYEESGLSGDIVVRGTVADDRVSIVLEDSAIPFDPATVTPPDLESLSAPAEERTVGGLGLFLVLKGVDLFHYEWDRENRLNRNTFTMYRRDL